MVAVYERQGGFRTTRIVLPSGDAGTRTTLDIMRAFALEGSRQVEVRDAAIGIVRMAGVRSHDLIGQLRALFEFVRDRILFVRDIYGVETIQGPRKTLEVGAGDCDDRATLLVALARSIGIPAELKFRVIAANPRFPRSFSHVYVVAVLGGRSIALDPTYPRNRMGWEKPNPFRIGEVPA